MSNPLDPVRRAFDKAVGPFRKRQKIMAELKESEVGKDLRAKMVQEASVLDAEWVEALVELGKAMEACSAIGEKKGA
ncbi:MAG: hypothetical protein HY914_22380 [Desulfomonile tiedjei]|nr:hypothetical protein [Desulfomonile tiedjei]